MKALLAITAATVVIAFPAYRYYVIGALIANRIVSERRTYRTVPKGSKHFKRLVG